MKKRYEPAPVPAALWIAAAAMATITMAVLVVLPATIESAGADSTPSIEAKAPASAPDAIAAQRAGMAAPAPAAPGESAPAAGARDVSSVSKAAVDAGARS